MNRIFLLLFALCNSVFAQTLPNIVIILTDDQQYLSTDYMPHVKTYFEQEGVKFTRGYATTALCCPSRASILVGQYAHNHGVKMLKAPGGGFSAFVDASTLATWLQGLGYRTSLIGKYLNEYDGTYIPPGWSDWHAVITPNVYFNYDLSENGAVVHYGSSDNDYCTDVFMRKAKTFIKSSNQPFFLYFSTVAPHGPASGSMYPSRHSGMFSNIAPWRPPSYNEADVSDKPAWIRNTSLLSSSEQSAIDDRRRDQLRSLQAVDEAVDSLIATIQAKGQDNNTLYIFLSDNGYMWGEHRRDKKNNAYEESARVPFMVRARGITNGGIVDNRFVLNIDIAPTILDLVNYVISDPLDGRSFLPLLTGEAVNWRSDFLLENFDPGNISPTIPEHYVVRNDRWKYFEYETGEKELYNMLSDPYEMSSQHAKASLTDTISTLATRLSYLKTYVGCTVAPTSQFSGIPVSGVAPLTVNFTDQSTGGATSWLWNFGDGATSTAKNPSHVYNAVGVYNISLTTTNDCGSNNLQKLSYVVVNQSSTNLALNKPATASSTSSSSYASGKAVDGSTSTYWRSGSISSSTITWLRVDLQATNSITRVVVKWNGSYYAKNYKIQVSNDDANWITVYTDNAGNGGTDDLSFAAVSAHYVRVYMTKNNKSSERINEFEVYAANSSSINYSSADKIAAESAFEIYPNPFNPSTTIHFTLEENEHVVLRVLNVIGQNVALLADENFSAGEHAINWNAQIFTSGIYFVRLETKSFAVTKKIVFAK